jgi:hypothetical protein
MEITEDEKVRFWSKVDKKRDDECWNWTGALKKEGYGMFNCAGKTRHSHRISLVLFLGRELTGCVLHSCDNRRCVNPNHLREGTLAENSAEMVAKGRQKHGSLCSWSKLTEDQVRQIKTRLLAGEVGASLAREFGVDKNLIYRIRDGRVWKHVE